MKLSIIIVNYNAAPFLERCLVSLDLFLAGMKYEVCVVDNASTDGSVELIKKRFPLVQLIANRSNLGFTVPNNQGVRLTRGQYILFLNPDTEFMANNFKQLVRFMDERPEIGIIGPKLLNPDGTVQMSCRSFPMFRTALFNRNSVLTRLFPRNLFSAEYLQSSWDHNMSRQVDWVSGACLLARKTMLDAIGLFDEKFFIYCEDADLCRRANRGGWKIFYIPEIQIIHYGGQGGSRFLPCKMILEHHRSMWRYYTKHFRRNPLKDAVVFLGIVLRYALQIACAKTVQVRK